MNPGIVNAPWLTFGKKGGVPKFNGQAAIVKYDLAALSGIQNVRLVLVGELECAHPNIVVAKVHKLGCVMTDDIDSIVPMH